MISPNVKTGTPMLLMILAGHALPAEKPVWRGPALSGVEGTLARVTACSVTAFGGQECPPHVVLTRTRQRRFLGQASTMKS
jgi:hypothetical protein